MPHHTPTAERPETRGRTIRWARLYDFATRACTFGGDARRRQAAVDLVRPEPGEAALDVGCGPGSLALAIKERVGPAGRASGIDASPEMIELAREKAAKAGADIDFRTGVIERLPYAGGEFDLVTSTLMFHHLPDDLKRDGLAEIRRVLKPGGRFLLVDFAANAHGGLGHLLAVVGLSKDRSGIEMLRGLVTEAGFSGVEVLDAGRKQFAHILAFKSA